MLSLFMFTILSIYKLLLREMALKRHDLQSIRYYYYTKTELKNLFQEIAASLSFIFL